MLVTVGDTLLGVFARGIDPKSKSSTAGIEKYVVEGSLDDVGKHVTVEDADLPTVMIGRELASKLLVERGDTIRLMSPRFSASPMGALPRSRRVVVTALFDSGMVEYDAALVFLGIDDARALFGVGQIATGVEARLKDPNKAPEVAEDLNRTIGAPYWVEPWTEAHRNVFAALKLEKTAYFLVLLLIILVAAFTIVSTLYMVVMEKRRDIAVLKTMGADDASIARIFVMKGLLIGGVGTGLGALFGWLGCLALSHYEFIHLPEGVFYVKTLPIRMEPMNFAMVVGASMVICLGACLFPAWKASRVVPVDVLRYE
jgi:lipoprotein-releasing system permease protein